MRQFLWSSKLLVSASLAVAVAYFTTAVSAPARAHDEHHKYNDDHHEVSNGFAAGAPGDPKKPFRLVNLVMKEGDGSMTYDPAEVDVKKGEQIKFVIKNAGTLDHEFFLDSIEHNAAHKLEMQKNPEMEHDDPNAQRLTPGKQVEVLWQFSKAGTFEFACLIPGHYEAGMHGKVVVK